VTAGGGRHRRQNPNAGPPPEEYDEPRVIRDKRRIDPLTGAVRDQAGAPAPGGSSAPPGQVPVGEAPTAAESAPEESADVSTLQTQLDERTADLQRLQAEYMNYRRRVERDREAVREMATAGVLAELLSVLDDIGRAREHGELEGGFRSVAESLEAAVTKLGLERYGDAGEPFDPNVHEALMHSYSADVSEPTCVQVLQPGYRLGERVLRPARVAVAEPEEGEHAAGEAAGLAEGEQAFSAADDTGSVDTGAHGNAPESDEK
jgi:molecular chaperone GrpE